METVGALRRIRLIYLAADRFLKNLKLVAVDELHYYADLFGRSETCAGRQPVFGLNFFSSHVTQVIRRFRRVCAAVGSEWFLTISLRYYNHICV